MAKKKHITTACVKIDGTMKCRLFSVGKCDYASIDPSLPNKKCDFCKAGGRCGNEDAWPKNMAKAIPKPKTVAKSVPKSTDPKPVPVEKAEKPRMEREEINPNQKLGRMLNLADMILNRRDEVNTSVEVEFADLILSLSDWLSDGGALPSRWAKGQRKKKIKTKNSVQKMTVTRRSEFLDDMRKLKGLPPHNDPGNICYGDWVFAKSLEKKYQMTSDELHEAFTGYTGP